jgi:quinol monooxygenase YgiN
MIQLIVTVRVRPGRVPDYVAAFTAMAPAVRLEPGCLDYDLYRDSADARFDNEVRPDTVVFCEKWDSIEALQTHTRTSVALERFRRAVKDIKIDSTYLLLTPVVTG